MQTEIFRSYRLEHVFGAVTEALAAEIAGFWVRNGAISGIDRAQGRASEACWTARDPAGELVAVCTLYTADFGNPRTPHYFYRTYIRRADRKSGLAVEMLRLTRIRLAADHRPGQPQQGLVLVTENPMLMQAGMHQLFRAWGWTYEGKTERGHDVWRLGYERMAPPEQPAG